MTQIPEENTPDWYRIEMLVTNSEAASTALWGCGAAGVEVQDRETFMEGDTIPPVPEGKARLIAFFTGAAEEVALEAMERAGLDCELVSHALFTDRSWETAWMDYFKPVYISRRVIVGPPWEEFEAPEGGTKLVIEPGMAFGTGTHDTTQLCAQLLDDLLHGDAPASVLDVGCGSAILSMAAARLGAGPVLGIDVDRYAMEVARANLVVNDLQDVVDLPDLDLDEVDGTYEIVVANILAHILLSLKDGLISHVAPGGTLLLGGITEDKLDDVQKAFLVGPQWTLREKRQAGEWIALRFEHTEGD